MTDNPLPTEAAPAFAAWPDEEQLGTKLQAAGIGSDPATVSLAQDWRTLDLVSWETANRALVLLDRYDLTDGAIVAAATNAARAACPAD